MRLSQSPRRIRARGTIVPAVLVLALAATPAATVAPDDGSTAYAAGAGGVAYETDALGRPQISNTGQAYLDAKLPIRHRVEDLLRRMTLEEKVGQMTQAERGAVTGDASLIKVWGLGSVLSGGGSVPTPTPRRVGRTWSTGSRRRR